MFENKTQQFSRFYLNDNRSRFFDFKETEFHVEEIKVSTQKGK